jgi:rifampicin phosphotransferase
MAEMNPSVTFGPLTDGRWSEADHVPPATRSLWCRGNVGEVFPNVMTPMSSSLYISRVAKGQADAAFRFGMVTSAQMKNFRIDQAFSTGVFGGYLYANVTMTRAVASRTPGLTVDMVDNQMFGLSDAPPHVRQKGEIDLRAVARTMSLMRSIFRQPSDVPVVKDQREISAYSAAQPAPSTATVEELLATAFSVGPWAERMMHNLLHRSALAGMSRSLLERLVAKLGDADLVNRLTAGLGTIESAEPAHDLWRLGRTVAADESLTLIFNEGDAQRVTTLDQRLRASASAHAFIAEFDAFRSRHRARGPDEWELASPTWESEPAIALAMIDRLRHAPDDRDPVASARRLATERLEAAETTRAKLSIVMRAAFDRAMRATAVYSAQREATKAAYMRATSPAREALAELARRSPFDHAEFFLLRFEEIRAALSSPDSFSVVIAQRTARRDFLQSRLPPFWFEGPQIDPTSWTPRVERGVVDVSARTITGLAVCPGIATGPARVITNPSDPRGIEPGDILVAPLTDPAWTPLFLSAAGVVVDVGAQQSHAAIVARELGIPAIVSATGASLSIADGAMITVDGSRGTVTVHPS